MQKAGEEAGKCLHSLSDDQPRLMQRGGLPNTLNTGCGEGSDDKRKEALGIS